MIYFLVLNSFLAETMKYIQIASFYEDSDFDPEFDTIEHFSWIQPGEPEISQENAYSEALKYIDEMGIGLEIYAAEPCTVLVNQVKKSTGWQFAFTRSISKLQAQYNDIGLMVSPFSVPSYGAPWLQEMCRIVVDKDGLCILWWQGASEISNVIASSVQLESFNNIEQRIVNQLNYMYGTHENGSGYGLDIKITEIRLGISLISEKDKTDSGIYTDMVRKLWFEVERRGRYGRKLGIQSGHVQRS
jgi:hypothetical protein